MAETPKEILERVQDGTYLDHVKLTNILMRVHNGTIGPLTAEDEIDALLVPVRALLDRLEMTEGWAWCDDSEDPILWELYVGEKPGMDRQAAALLTIKPEPDHE